MNDVIKADKITKAFCREHETCEGCEACGITIFGACELGILYNESRDYWTEEFLARNDSEWIFKAAIECKKQACGDCELIPDNCWRLKCATKNNEYRHSMRY